jgi:protein-S-isoprenylcysteine O-methyltransferase Ste14
MGAIMPSASALRVVVPALWLAWAAIWIIAARSTKPTRWREGVGSRALHVVPALACVILLAAPHWLPRALLLRFRPQGLLLPVIGAVIVAGGLGVSVWARLHLGRNWSGIVTLKEGHALIRSGPYRVVRHPIYTGLLIAILGTALTIGEWRGLLAVACVLAGFLWKIHVEERQLRETFPEYDQYCRETAALIPLLY